MSQDKTLHFIGLLSVNDVIPVDFASFRNNISLASVLVDAADTAKKGCICDGRAPSSCRGRENDELGISRCIIFGSSGTARGGIHYSWHPPQGLFSLESADSFRPVESSPPNSSGTGDGFMS
jgi:hypothetical protein